MKIVVSSSLFEAVMEDFLGYEGFFYRIYDEPAFVTDIFNLWGQKVYDLYASIIGLGEVGAIFHGDDLGFKTGTLISPKDLHKLFFPWMKKYVELARKFGKPFWYHCCGDIYSNGVIEDLIEVVKIDALHSFQDIILPVTDFKSRYGIRVAALGGMDMDKLASMDEDSLRQNIRSILEACMQGGRFALGSGNTVANYIPINNYLVMLDESRKWPH
jgi:uroporphyrinogen decarboxylase